MAGDVETTEAQFNVKALRRAFRMTQIEFASALGVSVNTVVRYEADRDANPTPSFRKLLTVIANHPEVMDYFKKTS
jgi:DNA-binding transcriptional regulator YiaG